MSVISGSASFFSDGTTATGVSAATNAGIATRNVSAEGGYWMMSGPKGAFLARQIDYGPAAGLDASGRHFDLSEPLARQYGLDLGQGVWPGFSGVYVGKAGDPGLAGNIQAALSQLGQSADQATVAGLVRAVGSGVGFQSLGGASSATGPTPAAASSGSQPSGLLGALGGLGVKLSGNAAIIAGAAIGGVLLLAFAVAGPLRGGVMPV